MNDIILSPLTVADLRSIIESSVDRAFSRYNPPAPSFDPDLPIGIKEAMAITGLAKATIYSKVCKRELPGYKRGGKLYFKRAELLQWINSGKLLTTNEIRHESLNSIG